MESPRARIVKKFLELSLSEEKELENLVYLASEICQTSIAAINFVDDEKQYPVVRKGSIEVCNSDVAFCSHTMRRKDILEVSDASNHPIFADNPFVTGDLHVRFYAGVPLITTDGIAIGALCVIDNEPKKLTENQIKSMEILAEQVIRRLELILNIELLQETIRGEQQNKDLLEQAEVMNVFYDGCADYFLMLNKNLEIVSFNASAEIFFNEQSAGIKVQKGKKIFEYRILSNVPKVERFLRKIRAGEIITFEILANPECENAFWNRFTFSPAYNSKKELIGIACIGCDIDKEKKLQEKLESQYYVLSKIAQVHSHEIRHPLTNILAVIDLLKRENYTMTKQYIEFLDVSSKELDQVIRNVVMESYASA